MLTLYILINLRPLIGCIFGPVDHELTTSCLIECEAVKEGASP